MEALHFRSSESARDALGTARDAAQEIAAFCGANRTVLEYGAGAGIKTEILMRALHNPRLYVPVDIAGEFLDLATRPVTADFSSDSAESIHTESSRKYDIPGFTQFVNRNGWQVEQVWTDAARQFAIFGLG
jgi:uncharacterized SAM-dependent methyltransferase